MFLKRMIFNLMNNNSSSKTRKLLYSVRNTIRAVNLKSSIRFSSDSSSQEEPDEEELNNFANLMVQDFLGPDKVFVENLIKNTRATFHNRSVKKSNTILQHKKIND